MARLVVCTHAGKERSLRNGFMSGTLLRQHVEPRAAIITMGEASHFHPSIHPSQRTAEQGGYAASRAQSAQPGAR